MSMRRLAQRGVRSSGGAGRAFTLVEMVTAMALFMLVLAGVVAGHLYGLRMMSITTPKLGSSDEARQAVSRLIGDIRSAKWVRIGNGSLTTFTEVGPTAAQMGSAIQVYPTLNTNHWIRYFWDAGDRQLKVTTNGCSAATVVASAVSNAVVFTSEDFRGNILSNNYNNRLIGLRLEFFQIEYPRVAVGPGGLYDYYQFRTRIARRTIL